MALPNHGRLPDSEVPQNQVPACCGISAYLIPALVLLQTRYQRWANHPFNFRNQTHDGLRGTAQIIRQISLKMPSSIQKQLLVSSQGSLGCCGIGVQTFVHLLRIISSGAWCTPHTPDKLISYLSLAGRPFHKLTQEPQSSSLRYRRIVQRHP